MPVGYRFGFFISNILIAFANSGGGTLYIGITDSGEVTGLANADADMMSINNMLRDGIKPDVTLIYTAERQMLKYFAMAHKRSRKPASGTAVRVKCHANFYF